MRLYPPHHTSKPAARRCRQSPCPRIIGKSLAYDRSEGEIRETIGLNPTYPMVKSFWTSPTLTHTRAEIYWHHETMRIVRCLPMQFQTIRTARDASNHLEELDPVEANVVVIPFWTYTKNLKDDDYDACRILLLLPWLLLLLLYSYSYCYCLLLLFLLLLLLYCYSCYSCYSSSSFSSYYYYHYCYCYSYCYYYYYYYYSTTTTTTTTNINSNDITLMYLLSIFLYTVSSQVPRLPSVGWAWMRWMGTCSLYRHGPLIQQGAKGASQPASQPASKQASQQASKGAREQASQPASRPASKQWLAW